MMSLWFCENKMKKIEVVVAGGGFAGISFIEGMGGGADDVSITLVDPSPDSIFRPLLPDVIAGKVRLEHCRYSLPEYCRSRRVRFLEKAASGLEGETRLVLDDGTGLDFDYLVVACGADPEYHGNQSARKHAFTLYSAQDAARLSATINAVLEKGEATSFVVVGGGYTGLETATALKYRIRKRVGREAAGRFPVKVAELAPRILAGLSDTIAGPAREEVRRLGIEVITSAGLGEIGEDWIKINGKRISPAVTIWSAGVSGVDFLTTLPFEKDKKGRIKVNSRLHSPGREDIFVLGDCASFESGGSPLRMAVHFSLAQGKIASGNLLGRLNDLSPHSYHSVDYGYLVPLASGKAWGKVLGIRVGGRIGSILHYLMSVYRSWGMRNRWGVVKDLLVRR